MFKMEEDNKVEFKETLNNTLPKELVAFLNTDGGTVYVGIRKDGEIVGVENIDESMMKISDIITDQISPRSVQFIHQSRVSMEGRDVIKIAVQKGDKLFYIKKFGLSEAGCYIRIGSTCKSLLPEEISDRYIKGLNARETSIVDIPSRRKNLSFKILRNYLITSGNHINEDTFFENYHLLTKDGKFNYLAEILADENDIVINVATFSSTDKTQYLKRDEFGGKCLLLAMEQARYYTNSMNQTFVDLSTTPRKEIKLFDTEAFEQAWINACVHNKWAESNHPGIYLYSDRIEIESFGGLPKRLTKEQFLKGKSEPVNEELFSVFRACGFAEESGHGVPSVVRVYGEEAYVFSEHFIDVTIKFRKNDFQQIGNNVPDIKDNKSTKTNLDKEKHPKKQPTNLPEIKTSKKSIMVKAELLSLLGKEKRLSKEQMAIYLGISESSVRYHISVLQKEGKIKHCGPNKSGYWEIVGK